MEAAHAVYIEEYRAFREELVQLHALLMRRLNRKVVKQAQRKLSLHRIPVEEEGLNTVSVVLVDYVLYHARPGGETLFEGYFRDHPPEPGSSLERFRQALRRYRYTLIDIEDIEEETGVEVYDALNDETFFLMDQNLARSGLIGESLASGLLFFSEYATTTGAMLPVPTFTYYTLLEEIDARFGPLETFGYAALPERKAADLAALILRYLLRDEAYLMVGYR